MTYQETVIAGFFVDVVEAVPAIYPRPVSATGWATAKDGDANINWPRQPGGTRRARYLLRHETVR